MKLNLFIPQNDFEETESCGSIKIYENNDVI